MAGRGGLKAILIALLMLLVCVHGNGRRDQMEKGRRGQMEKGRREKEEAGGLRLAFYRDKCNGEDVEDIVLETVHGYMSKDPTLAASLLRLQFHDCFLRGCDASIILESTSTNRAEQEAIANRFLRGLEIIDDAKSALEDRCPGVVSCADILALATRDAVSMIEGGPTWVVRTGRRDGLVSLESEVPSNIPSPFARLPQLRNIFTSKGFNMRELVVLSGAHTIGKAHCGSFSPRLYNNSGVGDTDPSLDPAYAEHLKTVCSPSDRTTAVPMDPDTPVVFDDNYYNLLQQNKGLFKSDAALLSRQARYFVSKQLKGGFSTRFFQAMVKLIELEVLTGTQGEIRESCAFVNSQ